MNQLLRHAISGFFVFDGSHSWRGRMAYTIMSDPLRNGAYSQSISWRNGILRSRMKAGGSAFADWNIPNAAP